MVTLVTDSGLVIQEHNTITRLISLPLLITVAVGLHDVFKFNS